ncbi:Sparc [Trichinella spiralis]|uniref:Sparc n=1 Tax=Trichinella spiralis TaxID=6334 RepID=A0A0V1BNI2_TRISP|nr:Sparc [Trichinella spiralis]
MLSTKFVLLVLLCLYACDIASTKKNKHGKKNDWDQLEPMLQQLHKMDNDIEIEHEDAKNAPIDDSDNETNEEAETEQNPCLNHVCGWGKECHVNHKGKAVCQCAVECPTNPKPDPLDKKAFAISIVNDACADVKWRNVQMLKTSIYICNILVIAKNWKNVRKITLVNFPLVWLIGCFKLCLI